MGLPDFMKAPDVEARGPQRVDLENLIKDWKTCDSRTRQVDLTDIADRSRKISIGLHDNVAASISDAVRFLLDFSQAQPVLPKFPVNKGSWDKFLSERLATLSKGDDKVRHCWDEFKPFNSFFIETANVIRDTQGKVKNGRERQTNEAQELKRRFEESRHERGLDRFGDIMGGDPESKEVKEKLEQFDHDIQRLGVQEQELSKIPDLLDGTARVLNSTSDLIANLQRTFDLLKQMSHKPSADDDLDEDPEVRTEQAKQSWRHLEQAFREWA